MSLLKTQIWLVLVTLSSPLQAGLIDFRVGSLGNGLSNFSTTVDGILVSFSNPTNESGPNSFRNDGDGLILASSPESSSWDVMFSNDVSFVAFTVDALVNPVNAAFDISGPGVNISSLQPNNGLTVFATAPVFLAGQTYNFAKATPAAQTGGFAFERWDIEAYTAAVPVPPASWLLGASVLCLFRLRRSKVRSEKRQHSILNKQNHTS